MRVLLVEDDLMIGESLEEGLRKEMHAVDWVRDGKLAELAIYAHDYDILLLDLGLPGKSGIEVLKNYRRQGGKAAVLILTARDGKTDRVQGLDEGADDYLVKPFEPDELFARIRATSRRRHGRASPALRHRGLTIDPATREASLDGQAISFSAREFTLLMTLLDAPGKVLSKSQLEERLYGWCEEIESNTIEVYVHGLRKKLGTDFIKNVRGVGYMIASHT
ncbi:response regulator transcription factor [uncultured Oxalicibacterium sp.]|uniref:response regulator transcription factor n=1 Tax=uncultured Oxalicibacterium sp. TaxID=1168540 RepID=UPI0025D3BB3C|nr:response regulator transcription factor [uncultured Oxalicibacterium sp.]